MKDAIIEVLNSKATTEKISVRPGEKYHESLISDDELRKVYEQENDYVIVEPATQSYDVKKKEIPFKKANLTERYSSNSVPLLTKDEIKEILVNEKLINNSKNEPNL